MYVTHAPRTALFLSLAVTGACLAGYAIYAMPANAVSIMVGTPSTAAHANPGLREESRALQARIAGQAKPVAQPTAERLARGGSLQPTN